MIAFLNAAGGVALLIFGIRFLNKGLGRVFADRLAVWLGRITGSAIRAAFLGAGIALTAPSSTTLSLLCVSLVQSAKLTFVQAMAVMFGVNVGLTAALYLISADVYEYAPICFLFGVALYLGTKVSRVRGIGQIILAVGLIFSGIAIVRDTTAPLANSSDLVEVLSILQRYPWLVAILSVCLTVLFQSSTAVLALVIGLLLSGTIGMEGALAMMFGANVGVSLTTALAGWKEAESRRLGFGLLLCRAALAGACIVALPWILPFVESVEIASVWKLALLHTLFNLLAAAIWLPFLRPLSFVLRRMVPDPVRANSDHVSFLEERWASDPHVAFTQTKRQIGIMAQLVSDMLQDYWQALKGDDERLCHELRRRDDRIDSLDREIKHFLTQQITETLTSSQASARIAQLRFLSDLESIGDVIDRNLVDVALKKARKGVRFSEEGWGQLKFFFDLVVRHFELATATFVSEDPGMARKLLAMKDEIRDQELLLREAHYRRLQHGTSASFETTDLHIELLTQLKHISHLASGVAYAVIERNGFSTAIPPSRTLAAGAREDETSDAPI